MPAFTFQDREYNNPVELALDVIGGKWKMPILWRLNERLYRYNELRRGLGNVTDKMLTQQLREMEAHGLITRTIYPQVPPKVEYRITELGKTALPIIEALRRWGKDYRDIQSNQPAVK
jgi:DNA-binding HxlR family transcriptional regulator